MELTVNSFHIKFYLFFYFYVEMFNLTYFVLSWMNCDIFYWINFGKSEACCQSDRQLVQNVVIIYTHCANHSYYFKLGICTHISTFSWRVGHLRIISSNIKNWCKMSLLSSLRKPSFMISILPFALSDWPFSSSKELYCLFYPLKHCKITNLPSSLSKHILKKEII